MEIDFSHWLVIIDFDLTKIVSGPWSAFDLIRAQSQSYDSFVLVEGFIGAGMGASAAIDNLQEITGKHGLFPMAFLIVLLVSNVFFDTAISLLSKV